MSRLRVRVELNRGGVGVPLHKLASVVHEAQRFFDMLAEDVHIATESGEWLGFDFDNEALNFTAEFVGPVSQEQIQAFYAAFDGTTSLRRATIAQFTEITEAISEDELIGFGLYQSDTEPEPAEWRCLSRRDALRIAEEMQLLAGVAGEALPETHLPAAIDSGVGAKLFKDRTQRPGTLPERMPELVREIEATLSKRITRIEDHMEMNSQAIKDLRESSSAAEESFKGLLNAVENFCGQATRQLERLAPISPEIPKAIAAPAAEMIATPTATVASEAASSAPVAVTMPMPATAAPATSTLAVAATPVAPSAQASVSAIPVAPAESTPTLEKAPPSEQAPPEKTVTPAALAEVSIGPAKPRGTWRVLLVAAAVIIMLATTALWFWPRSADSTGSAAPSSVIASSMPAPSQPKLAPPPTNQEPEKIALQPNLVLAKPQPSAHTVAEETKAAQFPTEPAIDAASPMQVEIEADEPAWVMITDKDGKILIAHTLQPNETRTIEVSDNSTLRTGNAGGLHVRLNGKDLGRLGPSSKIRDIQFKSGEFKVMSPDAR